MHAIIFIRLTILFCCICLASWIYPSSTRNGSFARSRQTSTNSNSSHLKINQVFSKHDLPPELIITDPNSNDGESASTSTDQPIRSGFFTLASNANGLKTSTSKEGATQSNDTLPDLSKFVPKKVVELPSTRSVKPNVIPNSTHNPDPLPLMISSVASGKEVTLLTNGFDNDDDDDNNIDDDIDEQDDENEMNIQSQISKIKSLTADQTDDDPKLEANLFKSKSTKKDSSDSNGSILVETKTESIDISDDENDDGMINNLEPNVSTITKKPLDLGTETHLKGYMYCSTNMQLGKVSIEWMAPGRIKLHLAESIDIDCDETEPFQKNLASVSSYMHTYIRERFYGVYPAHLRLEWIFIRTNDVEACTASLCDFNKIEPFSVWKFD